MPTATATRGRLAAALAAAALLAAGCQEGPGGQGPDVARGDADRGQELFASSGCVACHAVEGVAGADSRVGPRLDGFADQRIIAGELPHTFDNLVRWIVDPQEIDPGNAMPDMDVDEEDAADIAAFLRTLREDR